MKPFNFFERFLFFARFTENRKDCDFYRSIFGMLTN